MSTATIEPGSVRAWVLATRPRTLWAAVSPVMVGTALAIDDGAWHLDVFVVVLFAALSIQIGVNFANDVADATRGADSADRIGPQRAVASGLLSRREMWIGIGVVFGAAVAAGLYLTFKGGAVILAIGIASILAAFGYTNGPVRYGYRGFGEVFVFVFFGLVATVGTRFVFDRSATAAAWVGGAAMGLLATAILVANNFRDIETDARAGKRTLAVRIGRRATQWLYMGAVIGGVVAGPLGGITGIMPAGAAVGIAAGPLAIPLIRRVFRATDGPTLIGVLEGTGRLQVAVATLLALGVITLG